ncbi:unnamed protein product [Boreogadus saida]
MPLSIDVDGWTLDWYTRVQETPPPPHPKKKLLLESQHDTINEGKHRRMTLGIRNAILQSPSSKRNSERHCNARSVSGRTRDLRLIDAALLAHVEDCCHECNTIIWSCVLENVHHHGKQPKD